MSFFYDLNKRLAQVGQTQSLTESAKPAVKKQPSTIEQRLRAELTESYHVVKEDGTGGANFSGSGSLEEKWAGDTELNPEKKGMFDGRDIASLKAELEKLKASGPHKRDSAEYTKMKELNFAIRAKKDWKGGGDRSQTDEGMVDTIKSAFKKKPKDGFPEREPGKFEYSRERGFYEGGHTDSGKEGMDHYDDMEEGIVDSLKKLGRETFDRLGGGTEEDLIKDLQRKAGMPPTGQKPEKKVGEDAHAVAYNKGTGKPDAYNGMMFESADKKAKKDWDGDGKIESGKDEYLGSKIAAAKKAGKIDEAGFDPLKHIAKDKQNAGIKQAAKDVKRGSYADRAALMKAGGVEDDRGPRGVTQNEDAWDYKSPRPATSTGKFDSKKTSTGTVYTRKPETFSDDPEAGAASDGPRKRGRPAKANKAPERTTSKAWKHKDGREVKEGDDLQGYEAADIEQYDDMLDDGYGDVQIAGISLPTSVALRRCDPTAYRVGLSDFLAHLESEREEMDEEAVSRAQQKFMGMVHSAQKGEKPASKGVAQVAKTMKKSDAKDFASTKHKGLPKKVTKTDEEKTTKRDDHAERAGKQVAKDIEYDEKKKDGIHGKKRDSEDAKAERAGKRVAKDIEYDKKKKEKKVEETTTSGSVATAMPAGKAGSVVGKGIYDSINREVEKMISESFRIETRVNENMANCDDEESMTVTATGPDVLLLKSLLRNAGIAHLGHAVQDEPEIAHDEFADTGLPGEIDFEFELDEADAPVSNNSPDYPTNQEYDDDALQYSGGLNGPKSTGQATRDPFAQQVSRQGPGPVSEGSSFLDLYKAFSKIK
jgi:hypothetical protein